MTWMRSLNKRNEGNNMNVKYDVAAQATEDYCAGRPCPYSEGTARADLWHSLVNEWVAEDRMAREAAEQQAAITREEQYHA